jgi:cell division protease FtsH
MNNKHLQKSTPPPRRERRPMRGNPQKRPPQQPSGNWLFWVVLLFIFFVLIGNPGSMSNLEQTKQLTYSEFYTLVRDNRETENITELKLVENTDNVMKGKLADGTMFRVNIPKEDEPLLSLVRENVQNFAVEPAQTFWSQLFFSFAPIILIIFFIWYLSHKGSQMGNRIWAFGKSRAKISNKADVTFSDVAGVDEAKEELQEVIEFLKDPRKFEKLGGKIPKGVLLIGAPGTGKPLLARAVAGEAGVPFFSLSGSDFVEMFVGVGASRVRDLFEQARRASLASAKGAIIFIDEIDAVGRLRFAGIGGGNDEREQTLNALLVEMDGFNAQGGVICIAATNRPDTLDPALLRPGRFDRQIVVPLPDILGREGILKVHCRKLKLGPDVDFKKIAQQTVYFSGADLANVCNEAALLAARKNKDFVTMEEFYAAVERVTMGPEKKSRTVSRKDKGITAYHEAGHALLSYLIEEVDTFSKVSIIPRGMAGGYTLTPPTEDKHFLSRKELKGQMCVMLGGLVAEEIFTGENSTGVSNDLERVKHVARSMVCDYGMSNKMGPLAYGVHEGQQRFLGRDLYEQKDYSEQTAREIDEEVRDLVREAYNRARGLLTDNRHKLDLLANYLLDKEIIDLDQAKVLFGDVPPVPEKNEEQGVPIQPTPEQQNPPAI